MALQSLSASSLRRITRATKTTASMSTLADVALRRAPAPSYAIALASPVPTVPIISGISSLLQDIWESVLRAVPKQKTSHSKKRHRQMAGKALKDVTALNKCSSCGRTKRAHVLCPYCVQAIKEWWKVGKQQTMGKVQEGKTE